MGGDLSIRLFAVSPEIPGARRWPPDTGNALGAVEPNGLNRETVEFVPADFYDQARLVKEKPDSDPGSGKKGDIKKIIIPFPPVGVEIDE